WIGGEGRGVRKGGLESRPGALQMFVQSLPQLVRLGRQIERATQQRRSSGKAQQSERLIVQQRPFIQRRPVRGDECSKQTVGTPESRQKVAEALCDRTVRIPLPTQ